jgi:hypothetical protein
MAEPAVDWFSEATSAPGKKPVPFTNWYDYATTQTEKGKEQESRSLQERALVDEPTKETGVGVAFKGGFASDENETIRLYASQLYPNEPIDRSVKRFGKVGDSYFHIGDDGVAYRVVGPRDMPARVAAGMAGPAIPAASGLGAGIVTAPLASTGVGAAGSAILTGGAAAAGEVARQKIGDVLLGPAATNEINPVPVAIEGLTGVAGQGLGVGIGKLAERKAVSDISRFDPAATAENYARANRFGVPITPGEATGLASLGAQQKRLGNIATTSNQMQEFYAARDQTINQRFNDFLNTLSTKGDAEGVGRQARDAATDTIRTERKRLSDLYQPRYEETYTQPFKRSKKLLDLADRPGTGSALRSAWTRIANDPDINLGEMKRVLGPIMGENPDQLSDKQLAQRLTQAIASRPTEFRLLDYVKRGLDDAVEANPEYREIRALRNAWREELKQANPSYAAVLKDYQRDVQPLEDMLNSAVGVLSKSKDTQLVTQLKGLLAPGTKSPDAVRRVRNALSSSDVNAWNGVKRSFIQQLGDDAIGRPTQRGVVENPAGKLYQAFSAPNMRANLEAALTPLEYDRFQDLLQMYKTASKVQTAGSDTEWNKLANEAAKNAARPPLAKFLRGLNPLQLLKDGEEFLTNRALAKNDLASLQHVISNDPQAIQAMRELRKLTPGEWQYRALLGFIVTRGGPPAAEAAGQIGNAPEGEAQ